MARRTAACASCEPTAGRHAASSESSERPRVAVERRAATEPCSGSRGLASALAPPPIARRPSTLEARAALPGSSTLDGTSALAMRSSASTASPSSGMGSSDTDPTVPSGSKPRRGGTAPAWRRAATLERSAAIREILPTACLLNGRPGCRKVRRSGFRLNRQLDLLCEHVRLLVCRLDLHDRLHVTKGLRQLSESPVRLGSTEERFDIPRFSTQSAVAVLDSPGVLSQSEKSESSVGEEGCLLGRRERWSGEGSRVALDGV
eukprot:scaffold64407_cov24-Tisochrysis_lutea.AAC.1